MDPGPEQEEKARGEIKGLIEAMTQAYFEAAKAKSGEQMEAAWTKYCKKDCIVIRPSGNPLTKEMHMKMVTSEDVKILSDKVLSVDTIIFLAGGAVAVATYTTHSKFNYKGTDNDDIAKYSCVLEKTKEGWKIAHNHRGTGQKPKE